MTQDQYVGGSNQIIEQHTQGMTILSALQMRLDTKPILDDIEAFLRGSIIKPIYNEKTGQYDLVEVSSTRGKVKPKANSEGINTLMAHFTTLFNSQVVQGNYTHEMYGEFICDTRKELARILIINQHKWEIDDEDYPVIMEVVMNVVTPYFTRLIDNKERDSYSNTIRTVESSFPQKREGWSLWGNKG